MAQVRFHPHFDSTLSRVLASALQNGSVSVTCHGLDSAVLAGQVAAFAARRGTAVHCDVSKDKVTVHGKGRTSHPANRTKPA
jgi:hypothetical protein